MNWTLVFDGSEVQASEGLDGHLRLRLSAASVHRSTGRLKTDVEAGYLKPVTLLFSSASWTGDLPLCMGALAEGAVRTAQSSPHAHIALPGLMAGPLQAEFSFRSGAVLSIQASSLEAICPDGARFMPSYAC